MVSENKIVINDQKLGDNLFKKVEKILPNKIKRCQRIVGMFLDYKNIP